MAILASRIPAEIDISGNYLKQSFRNRFRVLTASGLMDIVIPILHKEAVKQEMQQIEISYTENWQKRAWRTITSAYGKAPYFIYYADAYALLFNCKPKYLIEWNELILKQLAVDFAIDFPTYCNQWSFEYLNKIDFRNEIHPKKKSPIEIPVYHQVFSGKFGFQPGVSSIDLLFNQGPNASVFLSKIVM